VALSALAVVNLLGYAFLAAIAIAILRYRLWDIDVIIRRTLIYSALTALLALAYSAACWCCSSVFRALTGDAQSPLITVVSTLAIAALSLPLRRRCRTSSTGASTAARSTPRAPWPRSPRQPATRPSWTRSAQLVQVVEETVQPTQASLWLRGQEPLARGSCPSLSIRAGRASGRPGRGGQTCTESRQ
jgi:hypothetical protein